MAESSARVGVEFQKERIIYQCCFHFRLSCYNKSSNAKKLIGEGWVFGMLKQGLYEQLINEKLQKKILEARKAEEQRVETGAVDAAESARVLADYVAKLVEKQLTAVAESATKEEAEEEQVRLVNQLLEAIGGADRENLLPLTSEKKVDQLLSVVNTKNSAFAFQKRGSFPRPSTSLAQSSLFTGADHEPPMYVELEKEIESADRIDLLVSFVKWSGLRLILEPLKKFTDRGGKLRIITTSYMGATDVKAIEELSKLSHTEINVSYDTERTRLHAKSYMFYRESGFSTAYIGSSNLSRAAVSSGLEWNIKITSQDQPPTMEKMKATFESYWNSSEFETYQEKDKEKLQEAIYRERNKDKAKYPEQGTNPYILEVQPYPYQQAILDKLQAEREIHQRYKNLLVAATGTGKTVVAALDFRRFCQQFRQDRKPRLLFVAHREELLQQSLATFRSVMRDPTFGSLLVGRENQPETIDQLFVSIQSFQSKDFTKRVPDKHYYDFIIIDEFHHAAAPSYQELLSYYEPKILLGMTATPERMDGKSVLSYFDGRIAVEIRLPDAIDRKLLCPFQYFGVNDTTDLSQVRWTRGGYDAGELSNVYSMEQYGAKKRADWILAETNRYVTDWNDVIGLGFCVSKAHAQYMSEFFNDHGVPAMYLTSDTPYAERTRAEQKLVSGQVKFIFVVDLYNEGVDIKEVNTILFLRPTESLTIFLQQLGRGLRLSEGKECLTVLDFIGQANKKYDFEKKFMALMDGNHGSLSEEIKKGFVSVPRGCYIHLEKKATEHILSNINASLGVQGKLIQRISTFAEDSGRPLTLDNFLTYYDMDIKDFYTKKETAGDNAAGFYRLCVKADKGENFQEPLEQELTKALAKICAIDSRRWIKTLLSELSPEAAVEGAAQGAERRLLLQMFQYTIWTSTSTKNPHDYGNLDGDMASIKQNPTLCREICDILQYNLDHLDFVDESVDLGFVCPLDLHCHYTKDQILVALGHADKVKSMRQGVCYLPDRKLDVFINTLNKADKDYSPTTMYADYSINEHLFHWQSQSTTSETSKTGQRYIHHKALGSKILLFVREYNEDQTGTAPFVYLGKAEYRSHQGSSPMNIIWRLERPIPAKLIRQTGKLLAQ